MRAGQASGPSQNGRDRQARGAHRGRRATDDTKCDGPAEAETYRLRRHPERKGQLGPRGRVECLIAGIMALGSASAASTACGRCLGGDSGD